MSTRNANRVIAICDVITSAVCAYCLAVAPSTGWGLFWAILGGVSISSATKKLARW